MIIHTNLKLNIGQIHHGECYDAKSYSYKRCAIKVIRISNKEELKNFIIEQQRPYSKDNYEAKYYYEVEVLD